MQPLWNTWVQSRTTSLSCGAYASRQIGHYERPEPIAWISARSWADAGSAQSFSITGAAALLRRRWWRLHAAMAIGARVVKVAVPRASCRPQSTSGCTVVLRMWSSESPHLHQQTCKSTVVCIGRSQTARQRRCRRGRRRECFARPSSISSALAEEMLYLTRRAPQPAPGHTRPPKKVSGRRELGSTSRRSRRPHPS